MKILPVSHNIQNFLFGKTVFCYDDYVSKQRRRYIREHLENDLNIKDIDNTQGRLSEYELNKLIKSLILAKPKFDKEQTEEVNEEILLSADITNFKSLYDKNNCYRAALNNLKLEDIEILKQAGIKRIVDLRGHCFDTGEVKDIEYISFNINDLFYEKPFMFSEQEYIQKQIEHENKYGRNITKEQIQTFKKVHEKERKKFNNRFVNFILATQKGNALMGCEFGTHNTDYATCLIHFFNPKAGIMWSRCNKYFGITMRAIYENLSPEDKQKLGWDEEYDKNFLKNLENNRYWID